MVRDVFPDSFGTRFALFVDTEEEFDWGDDEFRRTGHSVSSVPALRDGQRVFDNAGLAPVYLVDIPILESELAVEILSEFLADGRCSVGAHLHPWVTPPFVEDVSRANSYAGNLPREIERQKIFAVRDAITNKLGKQPSAYRAGRYGLGPNSFELLVEAGFKCDTSERPLFDYSKDGGPDYWHSSLKPRWTGPDDQLLELPLTTIFVGMGRRFGRPLTKLSERIPMGGALLARSHMVKRIPLTPEGVPAAMVCRAIDVALDMGLRLLNFSFHSPSLAVGHTPYVRTEADLKSFFAWWDSIFAHCARRGVEPASLEQIQSAAMQQLPAAASLR